jgi:hypothetical protein
MFLSGLCLCFSLQTICLIFLLLSSHVSSLVQSLVQCFPDGPNVATGQQLPSPAADPVSMQPFPHRTARQKLHPDIDDVLILVEDDPKISSISFRRRAGRAHVSPFVSQGNRDPGDNLSSILKKSGATRTGHHNTYNANISNVSLINIPKAIIQVTSAMERMGLINKRTADKAKKQAAAGLAASPPHATIDSITGDEDNLKQILDSRSDKLDKLNYEDIRDFRPFDHRRNRRKNQQLVMRSSASSAPKTAPPQPQPSPSPSLSGTEYKYDTRWGTISIRPAFLKAPAPSNILYDELTGNVRTFRTVFRMTGQLFRQYIFAPVYRALSRQVAADEADLAAQSQTQSQVQSNKRP